MLTDEIKEDMFDAMDDYACTMDSMEKVLANYPTLSIRQFFRYVDKEEDLRQYYVRAMERRGEYLMTLHWELANEPLPPMDMSAVQNKRVRIAALEYQIGKLAPKKYGTKVGVEHTGEVKVTPQLDNTQFEKLKDALLQKANEVKMVEQPFEDVE
ncbi:MAG: hypothetical protein EBR27_13935, partial [Betaproteobacteria bacterium]|nr:hypothetical protein [Betaproteobacteria bacterium]